MQVENWADSQFRFGYRERGGNYPKRNTALSLSQEKGASKKIQLGIKKKKEEVKDCRFNPFNATSARFMVLFFDQRHCGKYHGPFLTTELGIFGLNVFMKYVKQQIIEARKRMSKPVLQEKVIKA